MRKVYLIAGNEILFKLREGNDAAILNYILGKAQVEVWPYTTPFSPSKYSNVFVKEKVSDQGWHDHFELAMRKIDECELVIVVKCEGTEISIANRILSDYSAITGKPVREVFISKDILDTLLNPKIRVYFNTYTAPEEKEVDVYNDKSENWKE